MDESERREYIREVERDSSTIGADLPETVDVGGDELQLTEFLIETRKLGEVPPEAAETVETATRVLRDERRKRVDRLENDSISHETAEELVDEVNGFDRALNALETIRHPSFGDVAQRTMVDDYERWLGFLDTVQ